MSVLVDRVEGFDAPAVGITVEGLSTTEVSRLAIWRSTPGVQRIVVQGLGDAEAIGAGYWVDYLPPLGVEVTYTVEVIEGDPLEDDTASITVTSGTAWLQDALNPVLGVEVAFTRTPSGLYFTSDAFRTLERATYGQTVLPMGARIPVGMGSRRQTPANIPLDMVTRAAEASSLLREVLMESTHLVLRVPPVISMLDPVVHLSNVQVIESPEQTTFTGASHFIRWSMSGTQTRGPRIMAYTALWTYDDVQALYENYTYLDVVDGRTYVDWQAHPDQMGMITAGRPSGASNA